MFVSLLQIIKQYIVIFYKSVVKFIDFYTLLIVGQVLNIISILKSYLKSLYFKNNNPIIFILALPLIYDFNLLFTIFFYNYLLMFSSMLVYFSFSFLNFAVLQDGSLLSQCFIHLKFLFDHFDQVIALLKNISPPKDPFVLELEQDIVSIDTTNKDSYILLMKNNAAQQVVVQNPALYEGQPIQHVQAINNANNLKEMASALEAIRMDPNMSYQAKFDMLFHSKIAYTDYFNYLLKSAQVKSDLATIAKAQNGLSYCNNELPKLIATIPNKPTMPKL